MKQVKGIQFETGVIHGRLQILHNPDPTLTKDHGSNPHRSTPIANPLTYYERYVMIKEALLEKGIKFSEFSIVPFPINVPELLKYYVPMDVVFFLSIYDDWGRQKKKYLESLGLKVHVLWEVPLEQKGLSGSDIRNSMLKGEPWEHFLPTSVVNLVKKWDIITRINKLNKKGF